MRTTVSCDRNLSTLHSQNISEVNVQIMFAFVSKAKGGCSTTKFTSSPSLSSWPRSPDKALSRSSTSCRSASAAMAAWATPASSAFAPLDVRSMRLEDALPMLPKEDCVLSIRFFFGGVRSGGLMVTMLRVAAAASAGGAPAVLLWAARRCRPRLPGPRSARADRRRATTSHASRARRRAGTPLRSQV